MQMKFCVRVAHIGHYKKETKNGGILAKSFGARYEKIGGAEGKCALGRVECAFSGVVSRFGGCGTKKSGGDDASMTGNGA